MDGDFLLCPEHEYLQSSIEHLEADRVSGAFVFHDNSVCVGANVETVVLAQ